MKLYILFFTFLFVGCSECKLKNKVEKDSLINELETKKEVKEGLESENTMTFERDTSFKE